jgi:hypothetical protein
MNYEIANSVLVCGCNDKKASKREYSQCHSELVSKWKVLSNMHSKQSKINGLIYYEVLWHANINAPVFNAINSNILNAYSDKYKIILFIFFPVSIVRLRTKATELLLLLVIYFFKVIC